MTEVFLVPHDEITAFDQDVCQAEISNDEIIRIENKCKTYNKKFVLID